MLVSWIALWFKAFLSRGVAQIRENFLWLSAGGENPRMLAGHSNNCLPDVMLFDTLKLNVVPTPTSD